MIRFDLLIRFNLRRSCVLLTFVLCLIGWSTTATSQLGRWVAQLVYWTGEVEVLSKRKNSWNLAEPGQKLYRGDAVRTGASGKASISSEDGSRIHLNSNSRLVLKEVAPASGWLEATLARAQRSWYQLFAWKSGTAAEASIENDIANAPVEVETPTVTAGIRGTRFVIKVQSTQQRTIAARDTSTVTVLNGIVEVRGLTGPENTVVAASGYQVVAEDGKPLKTTRLTITPADAVQWSLYVPPLIAPGRIPSIAKNPVLSTALRAAGASIEAGDLTAAREQLSELTRRYPQESVPFRLLAVVLLTLNDNEIALKAAQRAVEIDPDSAAAAIVLSYAYQAYFDLPKALQESQRALALDPENTLALINIARLKFASDRTEDARDTLEKALELAPDNAEIYNLRGFILLAQSEIDAAKKAFEQAVTLDRQLGEPHMGLGLAHMRQGNTETALRAIEKAVLLDPQRSLFYSYWGKMLHQVKRFDKALEILARARKLDPRDPTPEFYRAIILRDLHRPGEALRALNNAIALNGNRAVYRSRFLLDRDLASRNVNLVTLYDELGLNSWARNKALASIKTDYTSSDGHLFYAGTLREQGGSSYSFQSEALLARLLQPANFNTFNNFNNYTVLFEQPGIQGTIEGFVGSQGVNGELFGVLPESNFAFNIGGFYEDTDGWRGSNFERSRSGAATAKWQPTPRDGIFTALSVTEVDLGDAIFPRYEYDSPRREDDRFKGKLRRIELGYHRRLDPQSDLLLYAAYLESDSDLFRNDILASFPSVGTLSFESRIESERPFFQGQAHYTFRLTDHQLMLGSLQYRGHSRAIENDTLVFTGSNESLRFPLRQQDNDLDISFESYYAEDIWQFNNWLTVEAALYYDRMRNADSIQGTDWIVEGFNPRLGVIVRPTARDTLRLAAFRYILPYISPRLDPTDVAGIEVYRNTFEGSRNTEFAFAWEHEWKTGFTSFSLFHLDEEYKSEILEQGQEVERRRKGDLFSLELDYNQLIMDQIGLSGGYRYLKVDQDVDPLLDPIYNVNRSEHLFKGALNYVHPDGFAAGITQTYRYIKSNNIRSDDTAAITDLKFSYQFPGRRGSARLDLLNLLDNRFNWVTDRFVLDGRAPERQVRFTLSFNF